jgi:hypothetical protein
MVPGHFAERHFAERTFCRRTFRSNGHFAERSFRRKDNLPNGQFAENRDVNCWDAVTPLSCESLAVHNHIDSLFVQGYRKFANCRML